MCTLIVLNEVVPDHPLVVAANRDERYDRKSSPPDKHLVNSRHILAPTDEEKGGTWMGVAQDGWFVGITNQDDGHHDEGKASRGGIVLAVLHAGSHTAAARVLASLDPERFNPFNLVWGKPGAMFLTRILPGQNIEMEPLPQGIHVISNDCWGHRYDQKLDWAKRSAWSFTSDPPPEGGIETIRRYLLLVLASHHNDTPDDPFQSLCVHADEHSFGTRSSSVITVSNQGVVEYWYSEGAPCQSRGLLLAGSLLHLHPDE